MHELLILHGPNRSQLRTEVDRRFHVVQEMSPYVVEVSGNAVTIRKFAQHAGGDVWLGSSLEKQDPAVVGKELTPAEHLFVDAWRQRQRPRASEGKKRIGEGLNWNTPGFKAP
jgi:hypothetical protein